MNELQRQYATMQRIQSAADGRPLTRPQFDDFNGAFAAWFNEARSVANGTDESFRAFNAAAEAADADPTARLEAAAAFMAAPAERPLAGLDTIGPQSFTDPDTVRALAPDERIAEHMGRYGATMPMVGGETVPLAGLVRSMVTGDWNRFGGKQLAQMGIGTDAGGGFTVPSPLAGSIIDKSRSLARVIQAGAMTVPMESSTLKISRVAGDPSAEWKAEHAAANESGIVLDQVELKAHSLIALARVSIELMEDSPTVSEALERAIAAALALELDRVALVGTGVDPQPRGILNTTGILTQSMGANGGALTDYDPFSLAVQAIRGQNEEPGAVIFAPRTAGELDRLKDTTGQPLQPPASYRDLRHLVTNQVGITDTAGTETDASRAFVGDYSQMLIGVRTSLRLEASHVAVIGGESTFERMQIAIRAYLRADIALAQPKAFAVISGITPPA